jgi:hypothetical protein
LFIRSGNRVVHDRFANLMRAAVGVHVSERELYELLTCPENWEGDLLLLGPDWIKMTTAYPIGYAIGVSSPDLDSILETFLHREARRRGNVAAIHHHYQTRTSHGAPIFWNDDTTSFGGCVSAWIGSAKRTESTI